METTTNAAPVDGIVIERNCICPRVVIECDAGQVSEQQMRRIADDLHASVEKREKGVGIFVLFGKHRDDCECGR